MRIFLTVFFIFSAMFYGEAQDKLTLGISFAPELTGQHSATFSFEKMKPALGYSSGVEANYFFQKNIGVFGRIGFFHKELKVFLLTNNPFISTIGDTNAQPPPSEIVLNPKEKENYLEPAVGFILRTTPAKQSFYISLGTSMTLLLNQHGPLINNTNSNPYFYNIYNKHIWNGLVGLGFNQYLGASGNYR